MSARRDTRRLLAAAQQLAEQLGAFRAQPSGERFAPTRLSEATRFLAQQRNVSDLEEWLRLLPRSFHAKISQSARSELDELKRRLEPLAKTFRDPDDLLYVLGWAERLLPRSDRSDGRDDSSLANKASHG